ncbi:tetratricopeptide repeat protein [Cytophaga aurantiaca]|uniref:tetratricopeptide repeat protein n=1 Tax=Cytophaga aurantiaca TaxID=29530 RepID=UPI00035F8308|nr:tetratricopeptide repeat protein [Cytophaga aurantiaca]
MSVKKHVFKSILIAILMPVLFEPALAQKSPKKKSPKTSKSGFTPKVLSTEDRVYFEACFIEGMRYYLIGQTKLAQNFFEKAYVIDETNGGVNYQLSKVNSALSNNARALVTAQAAIKSDPKNIEYIIQLASVYEAQGEFENAIKTYQKIISDFPGNNEYYYQIGAAQIQLNKLDDAIKTYDKIGTIYGASFELTRQKQQIYVKQNKIDLAIKEGQKLIDSDPSNLQYRVDQAEFYYFINRLPDALSLVNGVLKQDPDQISAHLLLVDIYKSTNDNEKVFAEYKYLLAQQNVSVQDKQKIMQDVMKAATTNEKKVQLLELSTIFVKANPSSNVALTNQGDALFLNGKKAESRKFYIASAKKDGNNYNLWLQIVILDFEFKEYDSLALHGTEAVDYFPNQSMLWYYRALGYYNLKKYPNAIESLEEAKNLSSKDMQFRMQCLTLLGDAYNETKKYSESDAAFDEVLRYDKNNDYVLNNYSYYLSLRKDKLELAKSMAERVVNRNPAEPNYIDTYAWVLYQMKDYQGAKKQLEIALPNTKSGTILEHYGDVLYQLGDKVNAVEYWKKAKAAGDASEFINKKVAEGKLYE